MVQKFQVRNWPKRELDKSKGIGKNVILHLYIESILKIYKKKKKEGNSLKSESLLKEGLK